MHISICIHVYPSGHTNIPAWIYTDRDDLDIYICIYICMHTCHMCISICIHVYQSEYTNIHINAFIYWSTCIHTDIDHLDHLYIHTFFQLHKALFWILFFLFFFVQGSSLKRIFFFLFSFFFWRPWFYFASRTQALSRRPHSKKTRWVPVKCEGENSGFSHLCKHENSVFTHLYKS